MFPLLIKEFSQSMGWGLRILKDKDFKWPKSTVSWKAIKKKKEFLRI